MNFEPFSNCSYLAKNFTLRWSFSPTRRYYSLIPVAMEGYDKIEWIKSWHMLVVLHLVAENEFEIGLFSKNAFWRAFIWPLSLRNTRIRHVSYRSRQARCKWTLVPCNSETEKDLTASFRGGMHLSLTYLAPELWSTNMPMCCKICPFVSLTRPVSVVPKQVIFKDT